MLTYTSPNKKKDNKTLTYTSPNSAKTLTYTSPQNTNIADKIKSIINTPNQFQGQTISAPSGDYSSVRGSFLRGPREKIKSLLTPKDIVANAISKIDEQKAVTAGTATPLNFAGKTLAVAPKNILSTSSADLVETPERIVRGIKDLITSPTQEQRQQRVKQMSNIQTYGDFKDTMKNELVTSGTSDKTAEIMSNIYAGSIAFLDATVIAAPLADAIRSVATRYAPNIATDVFEAWVRNGMPKTLGEATRNRNILQKSVHPNLVGGSSKASAAVNRDYEILTEKGIPNITNKSKIAQSIIDGIDKVKGVLNTPVSELNGLNSTPASSNLGVEGLPQLPGTRERPGQAPAFGLSSKEMENVGKGDLATTQPYKETGNLTTKILKDLEGKTTVSKQYILDATNRGEIKQQERDIIRQVLEDMTRGSDNPLVQEAKKYKSAEEFVRAQGTPIYRGDSTPIQLSEMDTAKVFNPAEKEALGAFNNTPGLYFTDSVSNAKSYGKNLTEVSVKPTANVINVNDAPKILTRNNVEKIIRSNPRIKDWAMNWSENLDDAIKQITDSVMAESGNGNEFLKAIWSDGGFSEGDFIVAMKNAGIDGLKVPKEGVNHFVIYNKDALQTKSQLTDIYNQAQKSDTINVKEFADKVKAELLPLSVQNQKVTVSQAKSQLKKMGYTIEKEMENVGKADLAIEETLPSNITQPEATVVGDPDEQAVINALKKARPVRKTQEALYSAERSKRIGKAMAIGKDFKTEADYYKQIGVLKGKLPKADFESLRSVINQDSIDRMLTRINNSEKFTPYENVRAKGALLNLFGELGGRVPTKSEIALLEKEFSPEFIDALISNKSTIRNFKEGLMQVLNIPRSLMSGFGDLSFGLRQGVIGAMQHPKAFGKAWIEQFKIFGSENAYKAAMGAVERNPLFELAQKHGVSFTGLSDTISKREEQFASSWAEGFPLLKAGEGKSLSTAAKTANAPLKAYNATVGKVVHATGRAYTAFANTFRMSIFDEMVSKAEALGRDVKSDNKLLDDIAKFTNIATGRGDLNKSFFGTVDLDPAAEILNTVFFSPRLAASRLTLLNPQYYMKADPFVRKEAILSMAKFLGLAGSIVSLASLIPGVKVETNTNNSDFGKIKIGNTRVDLGAGFQQYVRMASQLISNKYISSITGKEYTLGVGYKPLNRLGILSRQVESKSAPLASLFLTLMRQQDYKGDPVNVPKEVASRFTPIIVGDTTQLIKDNPELTPLILLSVFGLSLQTYGTNDDTMSNVLKVLNNKKTSTALQDALKILNN